MPLASAGLSTLRPEECRAHLERESVGRVVLSINALPAALPVNYRVIGDEVVFRSGPGGKLTAALDTTVVAFEVDRIDESSRGGWSVLVVGHARAVTDPGEIAMIDEADIDSWMPDPPSGYVAIGIERLSGRSLGSVA